MQLSSVSFRQELNDDCQKKKKTCRIYGYPQVHVFILVPELGIEPRCPCERGILSHNLQKGDFPSFLILYILTGYKGQVGLCLVMLVNFRLRQFQFSYSMLALFFLIQTRVYPYTRSSS